ncbi:MAG TPA: substrate-binding domain-containing protein [Clostridiaceae bacterium]|nr:substrate-binding domain-containing protein [Clostridiaceae bacterium]
MKKITLKDIADELGLSISTVHRALKGYGRINDETKKRIFEKAEELGYQLNLAASALSSGKTLRLGFIYPDTPFYNEVVRGARQAEKELSVYGLTVDYITTESYCPIQQSQVLTKIIENFKDSSVSDEKTTYDGIGIAPAHPILLNPLLKSIKDNGAEVITFNNDAPDSGRSCFIGQNPYVAGKIAGEILASIMPKRANIALMSSFVSALGLIKRIDGFLEVVKNTGFNVIGPFEYNDNITSAYDMSKQVILTNKIDAIYANSMYGSIGCARAIEDTGNSGKILMVSYDLDDEIAGMINKGTIFATIHQSPFRQGYYTIKKLYEKCYQKIIHDNEISCDSEIQYIKSYIIIKSNLEEFLEGVYL